MEQQINYAIECVKNFLDITNKIDSEWDEIYAEIGKSDQETSDLLHEIELVEFDEVEGFQLSNEIKKVRKCRREMKDYQEVAKYLKDFIDRNKNMKISLYKTLNMMEKTKNYQDSRVYNPRVRDDLKLCAVHNSSCDDSSEEGVIEHEGNVEHRILEENTILELENVNTPNSEEKNLDTREKLETNTE